MQQMTLARRSWLALTAGLLLLLVQSINLQHQHDGDLNLQPECQICMKLGSSGTGPLASQTLPAAETGWVPYHSTLPALRLLTTQAPQSRAPPLLAA